MFKNVYFVKSILNGHMDVRMVELVFHDYEVDHDGYKIYVYCPLHVAVKRGHMLKSFLSLGVNLIDGRAYGVSGNFTDNKLVLLQNAFCAVLESKAIHDYKFRGFEESLGKKIAWKALANDYCAEFRGLIDELGFNGAIEFYNDHPGLQAPMEPFMTESQLMAAKIVS